MPCRKNPLFPAAIFAISLSLTPLALGLVPVLAQSTAPAMSEDAKKQKIADDRKAAFEAADKAKTVGPAKIKLQEQGFLDLPAGESFVPQPQANALLRANGNSGSDKTIGLIFPEDDNARWWALLDYLPVGYVKDEEANNWNADELLANLKEGTEASNEDRLARGFPAVEITGWIEKPAYDAASHRLVWSAMLKRKGEAGEGGSVNYNTYALGREGYFSLDLITDPKAIDADKSAASALLAGINYLPGKGYGDFNASTDHIAEYGIAALIGGVALKKLGILALGAAFFLKFAKIGIVAVIALGAGIARLFRRKGPQA